jgi:NAD(P)-dependent dehydrogenase (short-subunit alcohol dehydrogenase family)
MRTLAGKTVLVMGAGSIGPGIGNGKAAALLYARAGAKVMAADVNEAAAQHGPRNIRANTITPGLIDTPLLRHQAATSTLLEIYGTDDIDEVRRIRAQTIPLGRFGDPMDVAKAAAFLASDDARYITGAEALVDGGLPIQTQFPMGACLRPPTIS